MRNGKGSHDHNRGRAAPAGRRRGGGPTAVPLGRSWTGARRPTPTATVPSHEWRRRRGAGRVSAALSAVALITTGVTAVSVASAPPAVAAPAPSPVTFTYTGGEQTYAIPAGATALVVRAIGAPGLSGSGASVTATIPVPAGPTLFVEVGGPYPGWGGGGAGLAGGGAHGGGGASGVQTCSQTSAACRNTITGNPASDPRLVVAGGAGGWGALSVMVSDYGKSGPAGVAGITGPGAGGAGFDGPGVPPASVNGRPGGFGGTAGGAGGAGTVNFPNPGGNGSAGKGGDHDVADGSFGGGGGGGWFGGGAGGDGEAGGGGGGGSSYWVASATGASMQESGSQEAVVVVTPVFPTTTTVTTSGTPSTFGQPVTFTATVDPTSGAGVLAFSADGSVLPGCGAVSLNGSGQGSCTTAALAVGSHSITASYGGDSSEGNAVLLASAGTLSGGQTVNPAQASQTITFTSFPPATPLVGGTYMPTATGGGSGNAVVFSIASGPCSMSAGVDYFGGAGTCVLAANQAGNANYTAAPQVTQSFTVGKASQTITFTSFPPATPLVGGTYMPTATGGGSGNAV
ncbi:MAG: trimeric autotransporter adhesin, partial [Actinomycetota bacterium]|nr:trimeric autotransporter adhesin [Actinomycetota bacterium]